jgi:hypothetical protein
MKHRSFLAQRQVLDGLPSGSRLEGVLVCVTTDAEVPRYLTVFTPMFYRNAAMELVSARCG